MSKTSLLATTFVLAAAGVAHAGGQAGSVGLGVDYQINPEVGGISLNYDAGQFHVGGLLGFADPPGPNNTTFVLGGRFFYHVHKTAMADFGLGGNLGIASIPPGMGMPNRGTDVFVEPGFEIRLFVASNVALSFMAGISIGVVDASGIVITGAPVGGAGIHYYFF